MIRGIEVGELYRHFKGGVYEIIGFAQIEKDCAIHVLYAEVDGTHLAETRRLIPWSRPISEFLEEIEIDGKLTRRFKKL